MSPSLEQLRRKLSAHCAAAPSRSTAVMAVGPSQISDALPWRGLPRGALHEANGERSAACAFLAGLVGSGRGGSEILWITGEPTLYPQGLAQLGLDHRRLIVVSACRADDRLWAMEESLRASSDGAVVAEVDTASLTETRRLQLAAEKSGSIGFLIRRDQQPSAALTRWRIESARSDGYRPCWRVSLERCRGAEAGFSWDVEWDYATLSFRLVAALADGSLAAAE